MTTPDPEERLIRELRAEGDVPLARALLTLSGLSTDEEFEEYRRKLDRIHRGFIKKLKRNNPVGFPPSGEYKGRFRPGYRARMLFEHLWHTKPRRHDSNILLARVIDAQLNPDINSKVGNCVGLTSLFTVLGLREEFELTILVSGEHILNRLRAHGIAYNIEHTDPLGFDCDLGGKSYQEYPAVNLLAHVLNSRGLARERAGDLDAAARDYENALLIRPDYANAYNNRGNMRYRKGEFGGAVEDYDRAIELSPEFVEAFVNRGQAQEKLGETKAALRDFEAALELDPESEDAREWLKVLRGRVDGL